MKSVGEAMAIGRTFAESLQKALRSLETGLTGLDEIAIEGLGQGDDKNAIRAALGTPSPDGILKVAQAMRLGMSDADIHTACKVDPWFLEQIRGIVDMEGPAGDGCVIPPAESERFLRCTAWTPDWPFRRRSFRAAPKLKCAAGVQTHRHLRGRIRFAYGLHVLDLRGAVRGACRGRSTAIGEEEGRHPRRWPEPHRPRHRVRLLLLSRLLRA
jgi:hypothetical protein